MSTFGRQFVDGDDPSNALEKLLPAPVDHVLLQADLTAIAPGPLEQELARKLSLVADVESRGGATVYRFAASSVRRAFDAGWSAAEVHDFVSSTSRTPVPQSLTYLVDDVSRRFGTLRAGHAESFLRSDDETALTELVHAPGGRVAAPAPDRADGRGLRRPARHPAPADPRARAGTGRRGRRRHRPGGAARRVPGPDLAPTQSGPAPERAPPPAPPLSSPPSGSATGRPARDPCAAPARPPRPT